MTVTRRKLNRTMRRTAVGGGLLLAVRKTVSTLLTKIR